MRSLIGIGVVVAGFLVGNLVTGQVPLLGLDLQGGVEVVLQPEDASQATPEALEQALEIIRTRVDALGVAEPDITLQGTSIVAQLPGVEDQERAVNLIGQTAELRFRPVLDGPIPQGYVDELTALREEREAASEDETASSEEEIADDALDSLLESDLYRGVVTPPEADDPDLEVILAGEGVDGQKSYYRLGPALFTGAALESAQAVLESVQWFVRLTVRAGPDGIDKFNQAASTCYYSDPEVCPGVPTRDVSTGENVTASGRLAVVLDQTVQSAPSVNSPTFERDNVIISGAFTEQEARELALVLDYGALPLRFADPAESGLVRTVSATLGRDDLRAGVVAGIIGLVLVVVYMLSYYRLLGLAAIGSLAVSGTLLWVVLSFLSSTRGLALTLAGVTGLIVAIGVSLDSNVVYFEHLKEDIRRGRTLRSAVDQAFPVAFKTIFWANLATLIGAAILWLLTIGSVRGFAVMLGIASILDLVATYFFLRPVVRMLARRTQQRPSLMGMPKSPAILTRGA